MSSVTPAFDFILNKNEVIDTRFSTLPVLHPRFLIKATVEVMQSEPGMTICDPACGTGGFLLAAHDYISSKNLNKVQKKSLKYNTFKGKDIVDNVAPLHCLHYLFGASSYSDKIANEVIKLLKMGINGSFTYDKKLEFG